ncbi:hypothetical protein [Bradyrhizobium stylosanthis]|uniref:hypothetical protein n=1 Tax=Bradyrhizobium stylosanthis TaxID=1803665 RepID=UPI000B0496C6|nr:hypothetical protein [Bradyrhizobium stylosanthis]
MMSTAKERTKVRKKAEPPMTQLAYTVPEFCRAFRISERHYLNLRYAGKAPTEMRVGRRVLISVESAQAWVKARELEKA